MTIFETLREDHEVQRELAKKLIKTHGDTDKRDDIFSQLKTELECHAIAEERCFYIPLMEHDLTQEKSRHSVAEHHELDELVKDLEDTDYSSPGWLTTAKKLSEKIHHHLDEEEHEVFQMGGKVLTDNQKTELSNCYKKEMKAHRDKV